MNIMNKSVLKTSPVYDEYWRFACERQRVYFNRLANKLWPWTEDPIIQTHKFTNAYRALDRVSQFLIREIIEKDLKNNLHDEDKFFRIILFKLFNKTETWKTLESSVGTISWSNYSFASYDKVLSNALASKTTIYSAAYIMASGKSMFGKPRKHQNHLKLLELMMSSKIVDNIKKCRTMQSLYNLLISYSTIGSFLAYQYATDINYSDLTDFDENEFVMAGPGARDGIKKCFLETGTYSCEDVIKFMMDSQDDEFERRGLDFKNLFGRPLKLIDCQNLFCETGKYARISHPHINDISGRTRIKQKYKSPKDLPRPCFPKKWGLGKEIDLYFKQQSGVLV